MAWEPSGNFRTFCAFSHLSYDDPIVYPGLPGASHLHMYFGNRGANARSTYQSLRSSGDSTCQGGPLNRSAYWIPALLTPAGKVVVPSVMQVYYKGNGHSGGAQARAEIARIITNPNGLRMIAGHRMDGQSYVRPEWSCNGGPKTDTIPSCPSGGTVHVELRFPMCWDGVNRDSADHRSHVVYPVGSTFGWFSPPGCPASHPFHLPELSILLDWRSDGNSSNWYLASDRMPGMTHANGSTFHADWFGAWDNAIQALWTQTCIRGMLNCGWGTLGTGSRLINEPSVYNGPTLIDPPPG
jgi:hypothetical protein